MIYSIVIVMGSFADKIKKKVTGTKDKVVDTASKAT